MLQNLHSFLLGCNSEAYNDDLRTKQMLHQPSTVAQEAALLQRPLISNPGQQPVKKICSSFTPTGMCADATTDDYIKAIRGYGIETSFSSYTGNDSDKQILLSNIIIGMNQIINALGGGARAIGWNIPKDIYVFRRVFGTGSHTITISSENPSNCQGDRNCNTGTIATGAHIYFNATDLTDLGASLVIHEFAHTLTNPKDGGVTVSFNGGRRDIYSFQYIKKEDGSYRFDSLLDNSNDPVTSEIDTFWNGKGFTRMSAKNTESEYSADAFLNWVLGQPVVELDTYVQNIIKFSLLN